MDNETNTTWGGVIDKDGKVVTLNENPKLSYKNSYLSKIDPEHVKSNKIPNAIGECADMLMNIKEDRTKIKRLDDELKAYAIILKDHVLECLEEEELTSSSGMHGCVTIGNTKRYSLGDKETFLKYVLKTEGYDLINSAVNAAAMNARVIEGEDVPGVNCFEQTQIKLSKRKA